MLRKRWRKFIVLYFVLIILVSSFIYSDDLVEMGGAETLYNPNNPATGQVAQETIKSATNNNINAPVTENLGGTYPISDGVYVGTAPTLTNSQGINFNDVSNAEISSDGTFVEADSVTVNNNEFSNVENFNVDNSGNILAQYLELQALQNAIFSMLNPINKCKVTFNIPQGGKITISNRDKTRFETISSSGIEQGLACQCSAGITFTAKENNAKLIVASSDKQDVHRYDMENLCLDYKNNKDYQETFCSKEENSFSKLSCASGIDTLGLGKESSYKYVSEKDNKKSFTINALFLQTLSHE